MFAFGGVGRNARVDGKMPAAAEQHTQYSKHTMAFFFSPTSPFAPRLEFFLEHSVFLLSCLFLWQFIPPSSLSLFFSLYSPPSPPSFSPSRSFPYPASLHRRRQ